MRRRSARIAIDVGGVLIKPIVMSNQEVTTDVPSEERRQDLKRHMEQVVAFPVDQFDMTLKVNRLSNSECGLTVLDQGFASIRGADVCSATSASSGRFAAREPVRPRQPSASPFRSSADGAPRRARRCMPGVSPAVPRVLSIRLHGQRHSSSVSPLWPQESWNGLRARVQRLSALRVRAPASGVRIAAPRVARQRLDLSLQSRER